MRQLGRGAVVGGHVFGAGTPRQRSQAQQRFRDGRAPEVAVGEHGPLVGAPGPPIVGMEVLDQPGADAPQRGGPPFGHPVGVARVSDHVAHSDAVVVHAHEGGRHGRRRVDAGGVEGDATDELGNRGAALVGHGGDGLGVVAEEHPILGPRGVGVAVAPGGVGVGGHGPARRWPGPGGVVGPVHRERARLPPVVLGHAGLDQAVAEGEEPGLTDGGRHVGGGPGRRRRGCGNDARSSPVCGRWPARGWRPAPGR